MAIIAAEYASEDPFSASEDPSISSSYLWLCECGSAVCPSVYVLVMPDDGQPAVVVLGPTVAPVPGAKA